MTDIRALIKVPLIIAAIIIIARIILEQVGAPPWLNQVFGVTWLYLIIPFYFAVKIATSGAAKPFVTLLKTLAVFVLLSRILIALTYMIAFAFSWSAPRFLVENGGVVGEGVTPVEGYLLIPFQNLVLTTLSITAIGMILGGIVIAVMRKRTPAASTT